MTPSFDQRREIYAHAWHDLVVDPGREAAMQAAAQKIIAGKQMYEVIAAKTGVPWYIIGCLHYRESSCDFGTHLCNGDSLKARTHDVPKGRIPPPAEPPFKFEEAAIDALQLDKMAGADWSSIERASFNLEAWNGWGYEMHGVPSAYLYAGTNQYKGGKYVADDVWDAHAIDRQCGVMGVLKCIEDVLPGTLPEAEHAEQELNTSPKAKGDQPSHRDVGELLQATSVKYQIKQWLLRVLGLGGGSTILAVKAADLGISDPIGAISTLAGLVKQYGLGISAVGLLGLVAVIIILQHLQRGDYIRGDYRPSGENR